MSDYNDEENGGYFYSNGGGSSSSSLSYHHQQRNKSSFQATLGKESDSKNAATRTTTSASSPLRPKMMNNYGTDYNRPQFPGTEPENHQTIRSNYLAERDYRSASSILSNTSTATDSSSMGSTSNNNIKYNEGVNTYLTMFRSVVGAGNKNNKSMFYRSDKEDEESENESGRYSNDSSIPKNSKTAMFTNNFSIYSKTDNTKINNTTSGFAVASAIVTNSIINACTERNLGYKSNTSNDRKDKSVKTSTNDFVDSMMKNGEEKTLRKSNIKSYPPSSKRVEELYTIPKAVMPGESDDRRQSSLLGRNEKIEHEVQSDSDDEVSCSGYYTPSDLEKLATAQKQGGQKKSGSKYSSEALKYLIEEHNDDDSSMDGMESIQQSIQASRASSPSDTYSESDIETTRSTLGKIYSSDSAKNATLENLTKETQGESKRTVIPARWPSKHLATTRLAIDLQKNPPRESQISNLSVIAGDVEDSYLSLDVSNSPVTSQTNFKHSGKRQNLADSILTNQRSSSVDSSDGASSPLSFSQIQDQKVDRLMTEQSDRIHDISRQSLDFSNSTITKSRNLNPTSLATFARSSISLNKNERDSLAFSENKSVFSRNSRDSIAQLPSDVSSGSSLIGENIPIVSKDTDMEKQLSNSAPSNPASFRNSTSSFVHNVNNYFSQLQNRNTTLGADTVLSHLQEGVLAKLTNFFVQYKESKRRSSLSPRSRNLADLKFLTAQHQYKVQQLSSSGNEDDPEDQFDFVLILQQQEVYAFWADLLDFRTELLGQEVVDAMEDHWDRCIDQNTNSPRTPTLSYVETSSSNTGSSSSCSSSSLDTDTTTTFDSNEANDMISKLATPSVGMRRRRTQTADGVNSMNGNSIDRSVYSTTPILAGNAKNVHTNSKMSMMSPGIYSITTNASGAVTGGNKKGKQLSLFERAIGTPESPELSRSSSQRSLVTTGSRYSSTSKILTNKASTYTPTYNNPMSIYGQSGLNNTSYRRGWSHMTTVQHDSTKTKHFVDSPLNECAKETVISDGKDSEADVVEICQELCDSSTSGDRVINEIYLDEIPNQTIARGIAARTKRNNGLMPFLNAMKRGVVVRKHRPGMEATFCRLFSYDDGDTLHYAPVDNDEAMNAFKEQRIRFNNTSSTRRGIFADSNGSIELAEAQSWSLEQSGTTNDNGDTIGMNNDFSVPDYVAADAYRKKKSREHRIGVKVSALATKVVNTGVAKTADIVAVHPARNRDPRSDSGELGSVSLRKSKTEYNLNLTFSLVIRNGAGIVGRGAKENIGDLEKKWLDKEGNESQFKYLDFEAATEGEYWLLFRGLLLLHRDAAVGRFAKERAAGIGGGTDHINEEHNLLHENEFHEPKTVGCFEKLYVKLRDIDTTYMEGYTRPGARPPPSDYFLGFRSPGTAIWSRLRQAGLETRRIYSLDPRRVMLKVRCPSDRLVDVAEVLRVKLKTKDGTFAPFQQDLIDVYDSDFDPSEGICTITSEFQFRSSIRQLIIDFIIGSRIRDSGAELGPSTDVGRLVEARVPLHMHKKLDTIYEAWFYFWRKENWRGRDGRSLSHAKMCEQSEERSITYGSNDGLDCQEKPMHMDLFKVPGFFTRFFVGCFYQPLDSIEQYFGEKVAFYFTWLQHTSFHLVFLSIAGIIVSICQITSNNINHPIRPYFSIVIMLWTFLVLNNWKKRANFMAYRWGTLNYKEQETTRPQFRGDYVRDEVTGEWTVSYPKWKRWLKYSVSFPLTLLFTFGTLIIILLVHSNRDLQLSQYTQHKVDGKASEFHFTFKFNSTTIWNPVRHNVDMSAENFRDPTFWILVVALPSMLGLFLPLLNFILMRLSIMLNDFENYRTESEYRTFLIIKVFSFRFVCYFATLYYYAFVSIENKDTIENGILRVGSSVLVYTTVAQYWQYFLHVCFPILIRKIRMSHRRKRLLKELREIELEEEAIEAEFGENVASNFKQHQIQLINKRLLLEQAQDRTWLEVMLPQHDSFPEYIQAVVQFAFVSCFSVVLPITPFIVLVNHLISMRLDAFKLCKGRRRPLAEKTGGIGIWEHLLHIVAVISVLTNCWLMGFTSSQSIYMREEIGEYGDLAVFAVIVLWEHTMLLIRYVLSTATSTLPKSVRDAMKKEQYNLNQQRNAMLRARRRQRDHDEFSDTENDVPITLTELNRRAFFSKPILQATTSEEDGSDNA